CLRSFSDYLLHHYGVQPLYPNMDGGASTQDFWAGADVNPSGYYVSAADMPFEFTSEDFSSSGDELLVNQVPGWVLGNEYQDEILAMRYGDDGPLIPQGLYSNGIVEE